MPKNNKEKTASDFGSGFFKWVILILAFSDFAFCGGGNGLRESITTDVLFVFEHFFYSVLNVSYKALILMSTRLCLLGCV